MTEDELITNNTWSWQWASYKCNQRSPPVRNESVMCWWRCSKHTVPQNKHFSLSNINFVNIQTLLPVFLESSGMMDCVYMSFPLSLDYSTINPEAGQNCDISTKPVSTWIAHQVPYMIFLPKIEWLIHTHTLKWSRRLFAFTEGPQSHQQWLPFCQSVSYLHACCVHIDL